MKKPYVIEFSKIGSINLGYISVAEKEKLPFFPKRIYWTYFTPDNVERGGHAHIELEQILIAVSGKIVLTLETINGEVFEYILDSPDKGVFIPKMCWRRIKFSHNAVQVCFASTEYIESDYIRSYDDFVKCKTK